MVEWYEAHWQALLLLQALWGTWAFAYALERRGRFTLRLAASTAVGMAAVELLSGVLWKLGPGWEMLTIAVLYGLLIAIVSTSWKISVWTAMFVTSSGYIAQNIASRLKSLLRRLDWVESLVDTTAGVLLVDLVCYGGIYLLAYFIFRAHTRKGEETFDNRQKAAFSVIVLLVCAGMLRLARVLGAGGTGTWTIFYLYEILCSCFILVMQYGVLERADLSHQVDAMKELLHQQEVQYETSRENAQLVNEKYHDLKKLLTELRGRVPDEQLKSLERHVGSYDVAVRTGSEVLDVVLAEKRMQCAQQGIEITCYAAGETLDFVEQLDLYSLLNNALTNAMEATVKLPEGERFITLTVAREGDMATVHVENSCGEPVELEDGLPKSRRDPRYHGFGMKSMARVAEKYGGSLVVKYREHMFNLDIILFAEER